MKKCMDTPWNHKLNYKMTRDSKTFISTQLKYTDVAIRYSPLFFIHSACVNPFSTLHQPTHIHAYSVTLSIIFYHMQRKKKKKSTRGLDFVKKYILRWTKSHVTKYLQQVMTLKSIWSLIKTKIPCLGHNDLMFEFSLCWDFISLFLRAEFLCKEPSSWFSSLRDFNSWLFFLRYSNYWSIFPRFFSGILLFFLMHGHRALNNC